MDINDYEIRSGRIIGEDKDESGRNKIHNIVDLLSGDTPTPSDLGSLAYKDSASGAEIIHRREIFHSRLLREVKPQ